MQTAVSWLEQEFIKLESTIGVHGKMYELIEQAKEMEKQQMDKVGGDWFNEGASYIYDGRRKYETFEQYYNETYGSDECQFEPTTNTSSATLCANCGREKYLHKI